MIFRGLSVASTSGDVDHSAEYCPGFCGRNLDKVTGNWSECQACYWGSYSEGGYCAECDRSLAVYDWLYLGFVALVPLLMHSFFIEYYATRRCERRVLLAQHCSSVLECTISALLSLILLPPLGLPIVYGCGKYNDLERWYTMFYNPTLNHSHTMRCSQEAVYPLYSLPFIYFAFCLLMLAVLRWLILTVLNVNRPKAKRRRKTGASKAAQAALYLFPLFSLCHAFFAGLIYFSFPYLLLLGSLTSNALHFALMEKQTIKDLAKDSVRRPKNLCVILTHMFLFGYCIVSMAFTGSTVNLWLAVGAAIFVPLPAVFYVLTVGLSAPNKLPFS